MMNRLVLAASLLLLCVASACNAGKKQSIQQPNAPLQQVAVPLFSADSAYGFVQKQVSFGPRVPGTKAHALCGNYIVNEFKRFGATLIEQHGTMKLYDGSSVPVRNIIAQFKPQLQRRVLLFAHWDTRPFADAETDQSKWNTPILGANDGASGVGVLLEIARHLSDTTLNLGVDIICFDVEDWGAPDFYQGSYGADTWCLGTQYWAQNIHTKPYLPLYGILLDMVGAPGATFYKEQISQYYASDVLNKVWNTAQNLGYSHLFINEKGGAVTDDHLYVNKLAGIPSIDIIDYSPYRSTGFGTYWHTLNDDMSRISKSTLMGVGQTLLAILYNE